MQLTEPSFLWEAAVASTTHRMYVPGMSLPVFTTAGEWLEVVSVFASHPVRNAVLQRYGITADELHAVLTAEAQEATAAGVSIATAPQIATTAGTPFRDVLLIRAGLYNCGLLSKVDAGPRLQLQIPRDFAQRSATNSLQIDAREGLGPRSAG
jgi:hypothetical protein